jgi:hypothetical protein
LEPVDCTQCITTFEDAFNFSKPYTPVENSSLFFSKEESSSSLGSELRSVSVRE